MSRRVIRKYYRNLIEYKIKFPTPYIRGNSLPGYLQTTDDMIFNLDFTNSYTPKIGTAQNNGASIVSDSGNYCVHISSGNQAVRLTSPTLYSKSYTDRYYSIWIKSTATTDSTLFDCNNGYSQIVVSQGSSTALYVGATEANRGWGSNYNFSGYNYNQRHHVGINYKGGGVCDVYIDGQFKGTSTNTQTGYGDTGSGEWIGVDISKYSSGQGYVGQLFVANRYRTAQEISDYYNGTKPTS